MSDPSMNGSAMDDPSDLPPAFDPHFYRDAHADLRGLSDTSLREHWSSYGAREGRTGSAAATRAGFLEVLGRSPSILEIGPLANPIVRGPHVRYFDVVPTEELRQKAIGHQLDPDAVPEIHYSSEVGDLSVIPDRFDAVVSAHTIEHQPDLIKHVESVAGLLNENGRYFLAIPDHRYCFDHFLPASTIADVLGARLREATLHDPANVVDTYAMLTHNDAGRHWQADHGSPAYRGDPQILVAAASHYRANAGAYIDTHAWQFTPGTFREITGLLFTLELSELRPVRVYETSYGSLEFYAILQLDRRSS